jgi:2-polyprenyl-3-methyl-5-hydroxy-6-metoxy-1,4-benzoquinol methylase
MIPGNTSTLLASCSCCGDVRSLQSIVARVPWRYFRCEACGGVQLVPSPSETDLENFYNVEYKVDVRRHLRQMRTVGNRMLDVLEAKTIGRRLLEVGCSYGGFLQLGKQRGWSCVGIEASRAAAEQAASSGLDVYAGTVENNLPFLGSSKFDVIVMWHVIEHLPNVRHVLNSVSALLTDGGYLAIRTPNAESIGARLLGRRWEWFYAPEHVFLYSARGLEQLLRQFNLNVESISSQRGDAHTLLTQSITAIGSLVVGPLRQRPKQYGTSQVRRPSRLRTLHQRISSIADFAGRPMDALFGLNGNNLRGSELVVLARKP